MKLEAGESNYTELGAETGIAGVLLFLAWAAALFVGAAPHRLARRPRRRRRSPPASPRPSRSLSKPTHSACPGSRTVSSGWQGRCLDGEEESMAGLIVWHELFTDDVERGERFYTDFSGSRSRRTTRRLPSTTMLKKGEHTDAGFVAKPPERRPRARPTTGTRTSSRRRRRDDREGEGARARAVPSGRWTSVDLRSPSSATRSGPRSDHVVAEAQPSRLFDWDELHATDVDAAASFYE